MDTTTLIHHKFNLISSQLAEDRYIEYLIFILVCLLYMIMYNDLNNLHRRIVNAVTETLNQFESQTKQSVDTPRTQKYGTHRSLCLHRPRETIT